MSASVTRRDFLRRLSVLWMGWMVAILGGHRFYNLWRRWLNAHRRAAYVAVTDSDLNELFKRMYADFRLTAFPISDRVFADLQRPGTPEKRLRWGGKGVHWSVRLA